MMKDIPKPKIAGGIALLGALLIAFSPMLSTLYGTQAGFAVALGLVGIAVAAKALFRPSSIDALLMIGAGATAVLLAVVIGGATLWVLLPGAAAMLGAGLWLRFDHTGDTRLGAS